jgi:cytochrome c peroxidase
MRRLPSVSHTEREERIDDETIVVRAAKMIAAYVRTLRSVRTPFDQFRDSVLAGQSQQHSGFSAAALRGLRIFAGDANCHVCHFGPNFSNGEFHDTGRPFFIDVGEVDAGRYTGIQRVRADRYNLLGPFNGRPVDDEQRKTRTVRLSQHNWGQWRTPSLRNLTLTAPYMHDGSLQTLRAVVDAYADIDMDRLHVKGESILKPLDLSESQREDLVAFLMSLSATSEPLQSGAAR